MPTPPTSMPEQADHEDTALPDAAREAYYAPMDAMIRSSTKGFWIAATPLDPDPLDMASQSLGERSRFYVTEFPSDLREKLATLNRVGPGREAEMAPSFAKAYESVIAKAALGSKALTRRKEALTKMGGALAVPRDGCGLSFIHHPAAHGMHWGSLSILFEATLVLPTQHKLYWKAGAASQRRCRELSMTIAELMLDELEKAWGLGPAVLHHNRDSERIHWDDEYDPSCQDMPNDRGALAMLESIELGKSCIPSLPHRRRQL